MYRVVTERGSRYFVRQDAEGRWWFMAHNLPNAQSGRLDPSRWWEIKEPYPWPPVVGCRLSLYSIYPQGEGGHHRPIGGGKITSRVVEVTVEGAAYEL